MLSLDPDPWNAWIYDVTHPLYDEAHAEHLRKMRAAAIGSAPRWMFEEAMLNDTMKDIDGKEAGDADE